MRVCYCTGYADVRSLRAITTTATNPAATMASTVRPLVPSMSPPSPISEKNPVSGSGSSVGVTVTISAIGVAVSLPVGVPTVYTTTGGIVGTGVSVTGGVGVGVE